MVITGQYFGLMTASLSVQKKKKGLDKGRYLGQNLAQITAVITGQYLGLVTGSLSGQNFVEITAIIWAKLWLR